MSIFNHNIYDNIRTRVIVLHQQSLLLLPPTNDESAWRLPGGGLLPHESFADCARREVQEETGIVIQVDSIAFLREWVVPTYCQFPAEPGESGFGLEVYFYATPTGAHSLLCAEYDHLPLPCWVPLPDVAALPLWPKEVKTLAQALWANTPTFGVRSFVSQLESPLAEPPVVSFSVPV